MTDCFEVQLAWEYWVCGAPAARTLAQLDALVRHVCQLYGRDAAATETALQAARTRYAQRAGPPAA